MQHNARRHPYPGLRRTTSNTRLPGLLSERPHMTSTAHDRPDTTARHATPAPRSAMTWLLDGAPVHSPWRLLAAIGAVGEAVAHLPVIEEHLNEAPYIGVGFVLLAVAGFILGVLLLLSDTPAVWASTLAVGLLSLLGFFLSRTIGLPQIGDDVGNWSEPLGIVAIICEAIMLVTAAVQLGRPQHD